MLHDQQTYDGKRLKGRSCSPQTMRKRESLTSTIYDARLWTLELLNSVSTRLRAARQPSDNHVLFGSEEA